MCGSGFVTYIEEGIEERHGVCECDDCVKSKSLSMNIVSHSSIHYLRLTIVHVRKLQNVLRAASSRI